MRSYGRIWLKNGRWHVETEPHVQLRLKRVFARIGRHGIGTITLSDSPETCRDLQWFCDRYPHDFDGDSAAALRDGARRHRDMLLRLEHIIDPKYVARPFSMVLPARSYQSKEAEVFLNQGFLLRSEEHTSELQSLRHLVCRLLL